jgi:hypothetical protein
MEPGAAGPVARLVDSAAITVACAIAAAAAMTTVKRCIDFIGHTSVFPDRFHSFPYSQGSLHLIWDTAAKGCIIYFKLFLLLLAGLNLACVADTAAQPVPAQLSTPPWYYLGGLVGITSVSDCSQDDPLTGCASKQIITVSVVYFFQSV